jgi:tetratricopeptide (TPR) repeat protein
MNSDNKIIDKIKAILKRPLAYVSLIIMAAVSLLALGLYIFDSSGNNNDADEVSMSGSSLRREGNYEAAAEQFLTEATEVEEELSGEIYEEAGRTYVIAGETQKAIDAYELAADAYKSVDDESGYNRATSKVKSLMVELEFADAVSDE